MKQLLFLLAFGIVACHTPKATNWAQECANRFPSRADTFRVVTETIKFDTLKLPSETVFQTVQTVCPPSDTFMVVKTQVASPCPSPQIVTKTVVKHDSSVVYQANTALEMSLKTDIDVQKRLNRSLKSELETKKRQINRLKWLSFMGWLIVAFFCFATFKIWKQNH